MFRFVQVLVLRVNLIWRHETIRKVGGLRMKFYDLTIPKQSPPQYFVLLLKYHFKEVEFFWY